MSDTNRTIQQTLDAFLTLEQELDLFEQRIDNTWFWEYTRSYVFNELLHRTATVETEPFDQPKTAGKITRFFLQSLRGLVSRNPRFTGRHDYLFISYGGRRLAADGKWWDVHFDPIIGGIPASTCLIERHHRGSHATPAQTPCLKYLDLPMMKAYAARKLRPLRFTEQDRAKLVEVEQAIQQRFDITLDIKPMTAVILQTRRSLVGFYTRLLKRVQPKLVALVSVNYPERAAIEACKLAGIPTVEMQHGVIAASDPCYAHPPGATTRYFPDYLLLYGDYWKQRADFPLPDDRVLSVGFPWFERCREAVLGLERKREIVVISQPTIGAKLSRFASELAEKLPDGWRVIYRLHPLESDWQQRYPWMKDAVAGDRLSVDEASGEVSLYKRFATARCQVGVYSAAIFEGLSFGLPTFVVDLPGAEMMADLIESGVATWVATPDELLTAAEPMLRGVPQSDSQDGDGQDGDGQHLAEPENAGELPTAPKPWVTTPDHFYLRQSLRHVDEALRTIAETGSTAPQR